jgi:hypothetical protein
METSCSSTASLSGAFSPDGGARDGEEWKRWDEELVEEFGRWVSRCARAFAVVFFVVLASAILGWF